MRGLLHSQSRARRGLKQFDGLSSKRFLPLKREATLKRFILSILALTTAGCVTIPANREGETPAKTFQAEGNFKQIGNCLYEKVRKYWIIHHNNETIQKTDLGNEVRLEELIPVPYAVGHGWTIVVKSDANRSSGVILYEGARGFNDGSELYDVLLQRFAEECGNRKS